MSFWNCNIKKLGTLGLQHIRQQLQAVQKTVGHQVSAPNNIHRRTQSDKAQQLQCNCSQSLILLYGASTDIAAKYYFCSNYLTPYLRRLANIPVSNRFKASFAAQVPPP